MIISQSFKKVSALIMKTQNPDFTFENRGFFD